MAKQDEQKEPVGVHPQQDMAAAQAASQANTTKLAVETPAEKTPTTPQDPRTQEDFQRIRRRQLLIGGLGAAVSVAGLGSWLLSRSPQRLLPLHFLQQSNQESQQGDQLVPRWGNAALQAIRILQPPMPVVARALAILHTCMFDAWAAYDQVAVGTQLGARLRHAETDQTPQDRLQAISYAAYRALVDLFPKEQPRFQQLMAHLQYDPANRAVGTDTPAGIGNLAAQAVLDFRHTDGSNQLGTFTRGAYSDYTHYRPFNSPEKMNDPNHWQPLRAPTLQHHAIFTTQQFEGAQWGNVLPFALTSSAALLPVPGPPRAHSSAYTEQARQIVQYSAELADVEKTIAEYWMNGPNLEQPPGHWYLLAQTVAQRDKYTLDQNIKLFFALTNALLDTSIACWATKRAYSAPYPVMAIHYLFKDKQVQAWAGPGKGMLTINGAYWQPYQPGYLMSPPWPEYCAEQSAFSSTAAEILRSFTGSDLMNMSYTQPAHHSQIEPETPTTSITLSWHTFTEAADQAGMAGRYSGMHFTKSDLDGRTMGRAAGVQVWKKVQEYINGTHKMPGVKFR